MRCWPIVILAAGCTGSDGKGDGSHGQVATDDVAASYLDRGPFPVGTAEVQVDGTDGLTLPTQIWYPGTKEGTTAVSYDGLLAGDAWVEVPADCASARPVVAFSHGSGGIRYQSAFFTEFLASWGFVVVAPDHVGNTFEDADPDYVALLTRRPTDIEDVVDWLFAASDDPSSPYAGCADPDQGYAIAGHSFGGYTTLALAGATVNDPVGSGTLDLGDDRVWAAIGMAPWDGYGAITDGGSQIGVPTLILTGAKDVTVPLGEVQGLWDPMVARPRYLGVFADAGHFSFSPVACLLFTGDGCGEGYVDSDTFTAWVDTAGTAFLEATLGVDGAIDQLPEDDGIEWTARP